MHNLHVLLKHQKTFSVFAQPDINTRGAGRILDSPANPRQSRPFAQLLTILPTPRVFVLGYANTGKKFSVAFIKYFSEKKAKLFGYGTD